MLIMSVVVSETIVILLSKEVCKFFSLRYALLMYVYVLISGV